MLGERSDQQLLIEPIEGWRAWNVIDAAEAEQPRVMFASSIPPAIASQAPRPRKLELRSPDLGNTWPQGALSWDETCRCSGLKQLQRLTILQLIPWTLFAMPLYTARKLQRLLITRKDRPCNCGINAYQAREQLADSRYIESAQALGRVELWGRVRKYEKGWRAQHARVAELWASDHKHAERVSTLAFELSIPYKGVWPKQRAVADEASRKDVVYAIKSLGALNLAFVVLMALVNANAPFWTVIAVGIVIWCLLGACMSMSQRMGSRPYAVYEATRGTVPLALLVILTPVLGIASMLTLLFS